MPVNARTGTDAVHTQTIPLQLLYRGTDNKAIIIRIRACHAQYSAHAPPSFGAPARVQNDL